jgi:thioredoxin 1
MVGPIVDELASEYAGRLKVVKVNTDEAEHVSSALGIMSIPTLAVFQGGKAVDGLLGAVPKPVLKGLVEKYVTIHPMN